MTRYKGRISFGVFGLLLSAGASHAQVASLGKGWLLDSGASITSAPGEVMSGTNSIKASGTGPDGLANFILRTDPTFVHFAPNQSYTMTWDYHVITAPGGGFGYGFQSPEGNGVGDFGPDAVLKAPSGTSGTASTTFGLNNHGDYLVCISINGTGSIVIDEIRITDTNGQLVASENAEGPSLAPGPLGLQVTDAISLLAPAQGTALAVAAKDLDGDGHPETLMTLYGQPSCSVPMQPIVIESSGQMRLATSDLFPTGVPTNKCTPVIRFADINNDGLTDIVFADAGLDAPPFTGFRIGVALNLGGGKYRDVTSLIPADQQTTRSYAIAVGDLFGDGRIEIVLPDENDGRNTALLRWNGNGFDEIRNWISQSIWSNAPALLHAQSWMELADFDRDGRLDLLVTGQDHNPNFQIVFGGPGGFTAGTLVVLPDGPFGHTQGGPQPNGTLTTAEVSPVVVGDFNNDGLPDVFAVIRNITLYSNGTYLVGDSTYQMRLNQGSRSFVDLSPSPYVNLGRAEYQNLMAVDMNNDGYLDVVGSYSTDPPPASRPQWGTTLFLNDGTGAFQLVDGAQFLGVTTTPPNGSRWGLGSFVPTVVDPGRTEGIVYQSVLGGSAVGLNLYKVVANGALGTGPDFVDPATLGVPGFNEFYYLRHYPDAAAAVQAGQYGSGLAHYVAVGKSKGYVPHAPLLFHSFFAVNTLETPMVGDFNGDGKTDIITFTRQNPAAVGDVYVALSNGTSQFLDKNGNRGSSDKWNDWFAITTDETVVIGDYDGDGRDDIATWLGKTTKQVYVARSLGTSMETASVWVNSIGFDPTDVILAGDVNGDGKQDLVCFARKQGEVYVALSTGTSFHAPTVWHNFFAVSTYERPRVADVNGDGKADIVTFATDSPTAFGDVYVAVSDGTKFVDQTGAPNSSTKWHDFFSIDPKQQIRIGDINHDGKDDFLTFLPPPFAQCYTVLSLGTRLGENVLWPEAVSPLATDLPFVGDVNGDGKADIIVFAQGQGKVYVSLAP